MLFIIRIQIIIICFCPFLSFKEENGYVVFYGCWFDGLTLRISFERALMVHGLPAMEDLFLPERMARALCLALIS